ncbi:MAG: CatB-related O-acetyltransferase [Acidimicrobiales bacterium]
MTRKPTLEARIKLEVKKLWARRRRKTIQEKFRQFDIGRGTYGIPQIRSWREGPTLKIGAFCSIAANVQIFLGGEHRTDWITTYPFSVFWPSARQIEGHPRIKGDVIIGNDVWIGTGALILSGVTIGDGSVIGAGAVVGRSVPPYAVVVGNPAEVVRKRFDEHTIGRLLRIRWWDWDDSKIEQFLPLMLSGDPEPFLRAAESAG